MSLEATTAISKKWLDVATELNAEIIGHRMRIEHLEAALRRIAEGQHTFFEIEECVEIAREALGEP